MSNVSCRQKKPLKVIISGLLLLMISILGSNGLSQFVILFVVGLLMLGYQVAFRIHKDFKNQKIISTFGVPLLRLKLKILFLEYISIFGADLKISNEWGSISALGTVSK